MQKLLIILGPTATGKTDLALFLAKKFNGELVSCDSRQVYRDLDIGTGKLPSKNSKFEIRNSKLKKQNVLWIVNGVKIWMYDVVDAKKQYTVADYVKDANRVIGEVRKRGKLPIIVGGTGLYLKALLEGLDSLAVPVNRQLRKKLERLSLKELQERLQQVSIKRWEEMNNSDQANPRRLIRAIEVSTLPTIRRSPHPFGACDDVLKIGLTAPREVLYKRVDDRVVDRINQGMVEEAEKLHKNGLSFKRMRELGLEYRCLADFLSGEIREIEGNQGLKSVSSQASLIKVMQNEIHGYVRRQLTWFKKEKGIHWFDITKSEFNSAVEKTVAEW